MVRTSLSAIIAFPRAVVHGAPTRGQQDMDESLYYGLLAFGAAVEAMQRSGTKTNFQTPLNDMAGHEKAGAAVEALADFIRSVGLPTTLRQLGVKDMAELTRIAQSVQTGPGTYCKCTPADVEVIFKACWE